MLQSDFYRHHNERVHIFNQFCPSLLAVAPPSVLNVTSQGERESSPEKQGRKEEGVQGAQGAGHRKWRKMKRRETM